MKNESSNIVLVGEKVIITYFPHVITSMILDYMIWISMWMAKLRCASSLVRFAIIDYSSMKQLAFINGLATKWHSYAVIHHLFNGPG